MEGTPVRRIAKAAAPPSPTPMPRGGETAAIAPTAAARPRAAAGPRSGAIVSRSATRASRASLRTQTSRSAFGMRTAIGMPKPRRDLWRVPPADGRGRREGCASEETSRKGDRLEPRVRVREAVLVALTSAQEAVLNHPVFEGRLDRVREQDETDGGAVPRRIAAGLVAAFHAGEAQTVPGCHGSPVELEKPEPKPAARECASRELAMESGLRRELRAFAPVRAMQREQGVKVCLESFGIVGQSITELVFACDPPLLVAQLLEQPAAPRRQKFVPPRPFETRHGARVVPQHLAADQAAPALVGWDLRPEKDVPAPRPPRQGRSGRLSRHPR